MKKTQLSNPAQLELFQQETESESVDVHPDASYEFTSLFARLSQSTFRSRFHLKEADKKYVSEKGLQTIRLHARDIISKRLAPEHIPNDGKQTPMRGHPVFLAQHATGCCCRGCLQKWHHIPMNRQLTEEEQRYIVAVLMSWIEKEVSH
jgi:exodeoxyribonuclease V alpha subunit